MLYALIIESMCVYGFNKGALENKDGVGRSDSADGLRSKYGSGREVLRIEKMNYFYWK